MRQPISIGRDAVWQKNEKMQYRRVGQRGQKGNRLRLYRVDQWHNRSFGRKMSGVRVARRVIYNFCRKENEKMFNCRLGSGKANSNRLPLCPVAQARRSSRSTPTTGVVRSFARGPLAKIVNSIYFIVQCESRFYEWLII